MHPAERRGVEVELDEQLVDEGERFWTPQQVREEAPLHGRPEREVVVDVELERDEVFFAGGVLEPLEDVVFIASADVDGGSVDVYFSDIVCRRSVQSVRLEDVGFVEAIGIAICTGVLADRFYCASALNSSRCTRLYGADIAFMGLKFLGDTKFTTLQNPHLLKSFLPAG